MSEFRTNKYIIFTLIGPPIVFAIILPVSFFAPLGFIMADVVSEPNPMNLRLNYTIQDQEVLGASLNGVHLENASIQEAAVYGSFIGNSTLSYAVVNYSVLHNVTVDHSIILNSNAYGLTEGEMTALEGTYVEGGEDSGLRFYLDTAMNSILLFFVMMPAIIPTVIASYTFVGEKLSRSLEPLLATPTTDAELLAGKSLAIFLPSMAVTWLSFIPMAVVVRLLTQDYLDFFPFLNPVWLLGLFLLAPLFCALSISFNVFVSSKVSDVRASQQLGVLVIIPLIGIFVAAMAGAVQLDALAILVFAAMMAAAAAGVTVLSLKTFQREEILVRWK
jgi:ABC-2 type transport system permease protein